MNEREILGKAILTYGKETNTFWLLEEMAELQNELCKERRGRSNKDKIAEEIADVLIMLQEIEIMFDCEEKVDKWREYKIDRLEKRIKEHGG